MLVGPYQNILLHHNQKCYMYKISHRTYGSKILFFYEIKS